MSNRDIDLTWFPIRITQKQTGVSIGSGTATLYGWQRIWVQGDATIANMTESAYGNVTGNGTGSDSFFQGVSIAGELSIGDIALARPGPGAGWDLYEIAPIGAGGGGNSTGSQDCGAFAGINGNLCLSATVAPASTGICSGITSSTIKLANPSSPDYWSGNFSTGFGNTTLNFTPGNSATYGRPAAWVDSFTNTNGDSVPQTFLTLANCSSGTLNFRGGYPICPNVDSDEANLTVSCPPSTFTVSIDCGCCDANYTGPGYYCVAVDGNCAGNAVHAVSLTGCPDGACSTVCSGPYANLTAAQAVCPPAEGVIVPCSPDASIPRTLFLTITAGDGGWACLVGYSAAMVYHDDGGGQQYWYCEASGLCSGTLGSCVRFSMHCSGSDMILEVGCGMSCPGPAYSNTGSDLTLDFSTTPYAATFSGHIAAGPCSTTGVNAGNCTIEISE